MSDAIRSMDEFRAKYLPHVRKPLRDMSEEEIIEEAIAHVRRKLRGIRAQKEAGRGE